MTTVERCDCTASSRCVEANAMWAAAEIAYRTSGHAAWLKALEPYNAHNAGLRRCCPCPDAHTAGACRLCRQCEGRLLPSSKSEGR